MAALFMLQMVQSKYHIISITGLNGISKEPELRNLTFSNWNNGSFQDSLNAYIDFNFGFRPVFVRLYNELQYDLFKKPHGRGLVLGKNNILFEKWHIDEYLGTTYAGEDKIKYAVKKLQIVRSYLKEHNTELMILIAPGKPYYFPEYLPDYYQVNDSPNNYTTYSKYLKESDLPVLDVNEWFVKLKGQIEQPLFTQTGTHWSEFGARLVADSLIKFIEGTFNRPMNQIHISDTEWSYNLRKTDNDLEKLMNIYSKVNHEKAAYAIIKKDSAIDQKDRPSMVVIGDSFFWNIYDGVLSDAFNKISYFYYYSTIYSPDFKSDTKVKDICVYCYLEKQDLVIMLFSPLNLGYLRFALIDDYYEEVKTPDKKVMDSLKIIYYHRMQQSDKWMNLIREKAKQRNISVDSMMWRDADYMAKKNFREEIN
ncbi:MAG: hypothetical protein KDC05_02670 [Bacteroidales bacterium]|nr:hypothetical protein [Bacteroidales bacterium]